MDLCEEVERCSVVCLVCRDLGVLIEQTEVLMRGVLGSPKFKLA